MTEKHAGGRPTNYNEDIQRDADAYVRGQYESMGDVVPSVAGLASALGILERQLYKWADKNEQFRQTLDRCKQEQHRLLLSGGLGGNMNSNIVKLMLSNHGYSDKVEQDNKSSDGSMSPSANGDEVLQALRRKHGRPDDS